MIFLVLNDKFVSAHFTRLVVEHGFTKKNGFTKKKRFYKKETVLQKKTVLRFLQNGFTKNTALHGLLWNTGCENGNVYLHEKAVLFLCSRRDAHTTKIWYNNFLVPRVKKKNSRACNVKALLSLLRGTL